MLTEETPIRQLLIEQAVLAVQNGASIRAASRAFHISTNTIRDACKTASVVPSWIRQKQLCDNVPEGLRRCKTCNQVKLLSTGFGKTGNVFKRECHSCLGKRVWRLRQAKRADNRCVDCSKALENYRKSRCSDCQKARNKKLKNNRETQKRKDESIKKYGPNGYVHPNQVDVPPNSKRCAKCKEVKARTEFRKVYCKTCTNKARNEYDKRKREQEGRPEKRRNIGGDIPEGYRRCSGCDRTLPQTTEFFKRRSDRNGYTCYCWTCWAAKNSSRKRSPRWLTYFQWKEIYHIYAEAKERTAATGIPFEVDHVWPLRGKNAWGLHVPWNLNILPRTLNGNKSNREDWYAEGGL